MSTISFALSAITLLAGCATKTEHDELAARVVELEKSVEALKSGQGAAGGPGAENSPAEVAAQGIFEKVNELVAANKIDEAKVELEKLMKEYGSTRTAARAKRLEQELAVVGAPVPDLTVEKWLVGSSTSVDVKQGLDLVVFWEVWCPHCRREVPKLEELSKKYAGRMEVVGLTKMSRDKTEEEVMTFIKESNVTYAMAKEDGKTSAQLNVSGIPAAALVKDGTVVWRGHPGRLTEEMINGYL